MLWTALADLSALLHGALVVYIVGGLALVLVGLRRRWEFVRDFWFRFTHLMLCAVVETFELAGQPCPLTTLEQWLRERGASEAAYQGSFIAHYVHEAIHVEVPPRVLATPTALLALSALALFVWGGPRRLVEGAAQAPAPPAPPPSALSRPRRMAILAALAALALVAQPLNHEFAWILAPLTGWPLRWVEALSFLAASLALCAITPRACGLRIGPTAAWRRQGLEIGLVWVTPPVLVAAVYGPLTSRPYHGADASMWLVGPLAEELLFAGFVYARLVGLYGPGRAGWRGALGPPVLLTAALFALWHWPALFAMRPAYAVFQLLYTFAGACWTLQLRRWTGSLAPGALNHVTVNYLASVL
jgi:membrane protease YdiL (CAAX protease family)